MQQIDSANIRKEVRIGQFLFLVPIHMQGMNGPEKNSENGMKFHVAMVKEYISISTMLGHNFH